MSRWGAILFTYPVSDFYISQRGFFTELWKCRVSRLQRFYLSLQNWHHQVVVCAQILHQNQIIHRDIKPMNVFVGDNDVVKVGDLGIAKKLKGGLAHTQIGTPHYMPPEIWKNRPYSSACDLWSLGCLLYEMMTYRHATKTSQYCGKKLTCTVTPTEIKIATCSRVYLYWVMEFFRGEVFLKGGCRWYNSSFPLRQILLDFSRVPFEARSINELRLKVSSGRYSPLPVGMYSKELTTLCQSLLDLTPQKRCAK